MKRFEIYNPAKRVQTHICMQVISIKAVYVKETNAFFTLWDIVIDNPTATDPV